MAEIIINNKNKEEYSNGNYPEVNSIIWRIEELDENILKNFPNLTELDCKYNKIKDLSSLQLCCSRLSVLDCSYNQITDLSPLQYCTALTKLYCTENDIEDINSVLYFSSKLTVLFCDANKIKNLNPLEYCNSLTILNFSFNWIEDLSPLRHCTKLISLDSSYNLMIDLNPLQYCTQLIRLKCGYSDDITNLSSLQYCKGLTELDCSEAKITDLIPLQYCTGLTELNCSSNKISDLNGLQYCTGLTELNCRDNQITSLEPLIYLRRLTYLDTYKNPLNPPSIQITRFLERIRINERNYYRNSYNTIYKDTQNIHDVKVQQNVMDSVRNLMKDKLPNNEEIILDIDSVLNSELKANTKSRLLEYFEDNEPHVILLITYKELFAYVWNRIISNPNKLELFKILDDNIQDSECKCFTGRFNRTLSTLVGFYDDIEINISDNSRISAIILQVKDTIIPYDPIKHKEN